MSAPILRAAAVAAVAAVTAVGACTAPDAGSFEDDSVHGDNVVTTENAGGRTFPLDAGMINVKTAYGAVGDGTHDDTAAIQRAISENIQTAHHILYFPNGTYRVSKPLIWKDTSGTWKSYLTLQGQSEDYTIIRLADGTKLYGDATTPTDVIEMGSEDPLESSGGGNDGFDNYIFDLTVDTGANNPGAVGIDFMGNNYCGLRQVQVRSSDATHRGVAGISMLRYASGPCLMKNIFIDGFELGITAADTEYGITLENVRLYNQRTYGIENSSNVLSIRNLTSVNRVPAIDNANAASLVTLITASLGNGTTGTTAIRNAGTLYARGITTTGYHAAIGDGSGAAITGPTVAEYVSSAVAREFPAPSGPEALELPISDTPYFEDASLADWRSVIADGADPTGKLDSTQAIQRAFDSGATTVYLPEGTYAVSAPLHLRGALRLVQGFGSKIEPIAADFAEVGAPKPVFEIDAGTAPNVTINHVYVGNYTLSYPGLIGVEQNSTRPVILKDSVYNGKAIVAMYENTEAGTGALYVEDIAGGPYHIAHPQSVFARQLDAECDETKIVNDGGTLWVLGIKTEAGGTVIETEVGGKTELLGGLLYPLSNIPVAQSAFVIDNASASLSYAVSSYEKPSKTPDGDYQTQVTETQGGLKKELATTMVPSRGDGAIVGLYRSK